jgi:enoyl-CoA hydratase/carnithine racemase
MCLAIDRALIDWADDPEIAFLLIDGAGERAFCAGGDIAEMYATGTAGDFAYGRKFWADEYRMNARLFEFPKPVVSFLQGFTMGGGVGVGCHGSHRIVCESSKIAMPECGIGLVPDVGGSLILARAPGRLGEYLGTTATRMGPADAIHAGFADYFIPEAGWEALKAELIATGDWEAVDRAAGDAGPAPLAAQAAEIDYHFGGETLRDILTSLTAIASDFTANTLKALSHPSPLAMSATIEIIHRVRGPDNIRRALEQEYRYTYRAAEQGEFLEGIRAAIIDKDRQPKWRHAGITKVTLPDITTMLMPLPKGSLNWEETP